MESLSDAAVVTSHRRDAELLIVATLFARIDDPGVDAAEGVALANAMRTHAEAADSLDLFELAMKKPHFRAWYSEGNAAYMKQRVLAAIDANSRSNTASAITDVINITSEFLTKLALYCVTHKKFNAWLGVLDVGQIEPTLDYYTATLSGGVTALVLTDTLARLVEDVNGGKLTRAVAMNLIKQCQTAASGTVDFASVNEQCVEVITQLYEKPASPPPAKRQRIAKPASVRDAIAYSLVYAAGEKMSFHEVWTILHEAVPALVRNETNDRTVVGTALAEEFGAHVRSAEKPRTYAVARRQSQL